jgi:anti-sigma B factor antagonist
MNIVTRKREEATIVDLKGAVDLYSSPQARKSILGCIEDGKSPIIMINLSEVSYIDSSGVATLVEGLQLAKERSCKFLLVGLSEAAKEVFELARLDKVFSIFDDEEKALKSFGDKKSR